jgi:hypothetical protein
MLLNREELKKKIIQEIVDSQIYVGSTSSYSSLENAIENKINQQITSYESLANMRLERLFSKLIDDLYTQSDFEKDLGLY